MPAVDAKTKAKMAQWTKDQAKWNAEFDRLLEKVKLPADKQRLDDAYRGLYRRLQQAADIECWLSKVNDRLKDEELRELVIDLADAVGNARAILGGKIR